MRIYKLLVIYIVNSSSASSSYRLQHCCSQAPCLSHSFPCRSSAAEPYSPNPTSQSTPAQTGEEPLLPRPTRARSKSVSPLATIATEAPLQTPKHLCSTGEKSVRVYVHRSTTHIQLFVRREPLVRGASRLSWRLHMLSVGYC